MDVHPSVSLIYILVFLCSVRFVSGDLAGTYQWKPKLGLEFRAPPTEKVIRTRTRFLVLIQGYTMGITIIALSHGLSEGKERDDTLNPASAFFYTNAYRWVLRYLAMMPKFLGAHDQHIGETHKVWEKRFTFMDYTLPTWLQKILFFVDDWKKEKNDLKKFKKYSEAAFSKHYRYPTKQFNDFASEETKESEMASSLSKS